MYEIEAIGASGSGGNTYRMYHNCEGGNGAKIVGTFLLKKGDVIDIVVGGMGKSGGGGGGTFIFKRIQRVSDNRYQFAKGDINYETLLVAAGGSGGRQ